MITGCVPVQAPALVNLNRITCLKKWMNGLITNNLLVITNRFTILHAEIQTYRVWRVEPPPFKSLNSCVEDLHICRKQDTKGM